MLHCFVPLSTSSGRRVAPLDQVCPGFPRIVPLGGPLVHSRTSDHSLARMRTSTMPRTNGHARRKTPARATPPPRTSSRRRASQPAPAPPAPPLPEDLPEHATLLPAPPEASYSLPAPP